MREFGGYIEIEQFHQSMLHEGAIALNCGRNCLSYLIQTKKIRKIALPYFLCDSVIDICKKEKVDIDFYHIDSSFRPQISKLNSDEWLYVVNFYGQLSQEFIQDISSQHKHIIVDNAQAYFQMPISGVDTIYTCRKFFGVADGAFLYTDEVLDKELPIDESFERMHFLLGRYERTATEFYGEYVANNKIFASEPIKKMSRLTDNLLHGIDYNRVEQSRKKNFYYLNNELQSINKLNLITPTGAFMYPLYIANGVEVRCKLQSEKIYIPTLWPNVLSSCSKYELEYDMAENILPLPCDQRYGIEDMEYIVKEIFKYI